MKSFLFGLSPSVDGSAYLSTHDVYRCVGNNVGNLAFNYAIAKILGGDPPVVRWHADTSAINEAGEIGVMACANQLGPHTSYGGLADNFSRLTTKLIAVGLGAQGGMDYGPLPEVPEGTLRWVREIVARAPTDAPNLAVRGEFTHKVLDHYGLASRAVVLGCPTLFINPNPKLGRQISERLNGPPQRVAVAAGNQGWRHLGRIEASLTHMITETDGAYIIQSPKEMLHLARNEAHLLNPEAFEDCRRYICPSLASDEFAKWTRKFARVILNISEWIEYLRGFDFVVGARIHGVMLGLQAGVPSLCIAHDSRTRELCETTMVPFVMAGEVSAGLTRSDLIDRFKFDAEKFDDHRSMMAARYNEFLTANHLPPSKWLNKLIKADQD